MNKKNLALVFGLMLNMVSLNCDEAQANQQEANVQVVAENVPTQEVTAPTYPEINPVQAIATPEVIPASTATDINPEEELTEEQLKELLDQILAEMKKEEEAKNTNAQASIAA